MCYLHLLKAVCYSSRLLLVDILFLYHKQKAPSTTAVLRQAWEHKFRGKVLGHSIGDGRGLYPTRTRTPRQKASRARTPRVCHVQLCLFDLYSLHSLALRFLLEFACIAACAKFNNRCPPSEATALSITGLFIFTSLDFA